MDIIFSICLLYFVALIILIAISYVTYILVFKKYRDKVNKAQETDVNKGKIKLKYCMECGEELNKKGYCENCKIKY